MVDVVFSHALEDWHQTQVQEKYLYLKVHAFKALSNALSAKVEDMIEMEYGLLESANILWNALEQIYGSSNNKRLSSIIILESISSSSMHIDQDHVVQSSIQDEKVKFANLRKPDGLVSQTRCSSFGRIEPKLLEEDDCSTSNSDDDEIDDDDDDVNEVLMEEFHKLISKHMKLQKRHEVLLYSHEKLIDSCIARSN
jgi:hypothetical protein